MSYVYEFYPGLHRYLGNFIYKKDEKDEPLSYFLLILSLPFSCHCLLFRHFFIDFHFSCSVQQINMSKILLLLGDSNVSRWIPHLGAPYLPILDYHPIMKADDLGSALAQVKPSYQMVVFAGLTNILVSSVAGAPNDRFTRLGRLEAAIRETLTSIG